LGSTLYKQQAKVIGSNPTTATTFLLVKVKKLAQ
jgi:hypothetical protein